MNGPTNSRFKDREVAPHPIANELTDDPAVTNVPMDAHGRTDVERPHTDPSVGPLHGTEPLRPTERNIGKLLLVLIIGATFAALVITALLTRQWSYLGIGLLLFIPFILLLMAPFWLATSTKIAQDQAVKQQSNTVQQRQRL